MKLYTGLLILDTNIFIEAHRRYYAFDIAPGFWEKLKTKAEIGLVKSIINVYEELQRGSKDKLALWADESFFDHFVSCSADEVIAAYTEIINWANGIYSPAVVAEFAGIADGWLIAFAYANKTTLVTNESRQKRTSKITIPDVCKQFDIDYIDVYDMLRELGITLH
ncbi:MAG: DUF4411 family protein [Candidatus Cloacimonetes bacterium]|jgi:predicted nucleic acid-binding protein|nr:DUF4411 family protein [Candidatus Cloacimonadota bacterium]NLO44369.1 DUF4411 family protein [Candidatus Cloacimonadota bacterium]